ncbi:MAG: hypothetical protein HOP02_16115 [Methylococcaceae bacterium]|nr:hypothetical protein [Methylococcaceae bacterium]
MNTIFPFNVYSLLIALCFATLSLSAVANGRLALVIGNADYDTVPLANALHDAEDIAAQLTRLGFEVMPLKNGTQQQMEEIIERFSQRLSQQQEAGLFYFAGHGVQANGVNYLIPVKSDVHGLSDLKYKAVDSQYIFDKMEAAHVKTSIYILDACRDNPFRGMRGSNQGLANMSGPNGAIIAFATAPGNTAADGSGRNGLYTKHLLKHMVTPGISIEQVFKRVRIDVDKASEGQQVPWENSSLRQDFCFINCAATATYVETTKLDAVEQEKEQLARELTQIKTGYKNKQEQLQAYEQLRQEKTKLEQALATLQQAYNTHQQNTRELHKLKQQEINIEKALRSKQQTEAEKERLVAEKDKLLQDKIALTSQISHYDAEQQQKLEALNKLQQENTRLTVALHQQTAGKTHLSADQLRGVSAQLAQLEMIKHEKEDLQARLETNLRTHQSQTAQHLEALQKIENENVALQLELETRQHAPGSGGQAPQMIGGF